MVNKNICNKCGYKWDTLEILYDPCECPLCQNKKIRRLSSDQGKNHTENSKKHSKKVKTSADEYVVPWMIDVQ